ncbi:hypothetical protein EMIT07CA2_290013 [Brevibacillus sp. IT-7CA2]
MPHRQSNTIFSQSKTLSTNNYLESSKKPVMTTICHNRFQMSFVTFTYNQVINLNIRSDNINY